MNFLKHALSVFLLSLTSVTAQDTPEKPNLIVILADDLGYGDVGFTGSEEIQTPVLDSLAQGGVIFENGYVTHPFCGPSRAGLMTGRYQARFGFESNTTNSFFDRHNGLPLSEKTFAERLKSAGYRTGIVGKWHLGGSHVFHPNNRGFDYFYGFLSGGHSYWPERVSTLTPLDLNETTLNYSANEGSYWPLTRNDQSATFDEYLTTALSRDAAKFVSLGKEPFCLYLAYNAPHAPLEAPKELIEKYSSIEHPRRQIYAAMIDAMDQGIGMVIEALEKSGKLDNTLIFFLSDNGGVVDKARPHGQPRSRKGQDWADSGPFRGGKGSMLEGGCHVPFIAHWPKKIPAGTRYQFPISAIDIAATFIAQGDADASAPQMDGVDLIPFVTGDNTGAPHHALFWRMNDGKNWAVRTPEMKYLQPRNEIGKTPMLFNLKEDPTEMNNIVDEAPESRKELAALWNKWNKNNQSNRFLEAGAYQKARLKYYRELSERLEKEAKSKELLQID